MPLGVKGPWLAFLVAVEGRGGRGKWRRGEKEEFITSGDWRGKHKPLSLGASAGQP